MNSSFSLKPILLTDAVLCLIIFSLRNCVKVGFVFHFGFPEILSYVNFYVAFRGVSGKEEALGMVVARLHLGLGCEQAVWNFGKTQLNLNGWRVLQITFPILLYLQQVHRLGRTCDIQASVFLFRLLSFRMWEQKWTPSWVQITRQDVFNCWFFVTD